MATFHFSNIKITGICSAVPINAITGRDGVKEYGIHAVRRSVDLQTASDLGYVAARAVVENKGVNVEDIGCLVFISTTPDYRGPATACVLQSRLKLTKDCLAFDVVIGGAGFLYGLQLGCSLLQSLNRKYALVVIGDTTSKQLADGDPLSRVYGDAACALLLTKDEEAQAIRLTTKAAGDMYQTAILRNGGFRLAEGQQEQSLEILSIQHDVIADFAVLRISELIRDFVSGQKHTLEVYDVVALPQSGETIVNRIVERVGLSPDKVARTYTAFGDVRGSSVPLQLCTSFGNVHSPSKNLHVLACGIGEGISWGVADFFIASDDILPVIETDDFFTEGAVSHEV